MSGKQQGTGASQAAVEENRWEFTLLGFLEKLPKGDPIPMECMNCRKLVECAMAKRAFDWYLGQNSPQTCKPERSRTGKSKHSQQ